MAITTDMGREIVSKAKSINGRLTELEKKSWETYKALKEATESARAIAQEVFSLSAGAFSLAEYVAIREQEDRARREGTAKRYKVSDSNETRIVEAYTASEAIRLADFSYTSDYEMRDSDTDNYNEYASQLWGEVVPDEDGDDEEWRVEASLV